MADGSVIISTELDNSGIAKDLKETQADAKKAGNAVEDYADEYSEAAKKSRRSKTQITDDLDSIKSSVLDLASAIGGGLTFAGMVSSANALIDSTEELRGDLSMLDQNARTAGVGIDATRDAMQRLNTVTGETDSSVEAVSNLLAAGVPENKLQQAVEGLANAAITFPDTIKIESLADSLQETLATGSATGQFGEVLDRLGIGAENFSQGLSMITDEGQRLDYALGVLNNGSLAGVYDGWAKANPEMVQSRDAALELQDAMANLAEAILPVKTDLVEIATGAANFVSGFSGVGEMLGIIASGVGAIGAVKAVETIAGLATSISAMNSALLLTTIQSTVAYAAFGALIFLIIQAAGAWDNMTTLQKVVTILGALTVAAIAAAMAVGAFQSALTMGIAAAAIVAGIAAISASINQATKQAKQISSQTITMPNNYADRYASINMSDIPQLAEGAVIPAGRRFLSILGDQKNGRNLEAPEGLIRQIVREESGGMGGTLRISAKAGFARMLNYELELEKKRAGKPLVEGVD